MVGPYDLVVAATALHRRWGVAIFNASEFRNILGLKGIDLQAGGVRRSPASLEYFEAFSKLTSLRIPPLLRLPSRLLSPDRRSQHLLPLFRTEKDVFREFVMEGDLRKDLRTHE